MDQENFNRKHGDDVDTANEYARINSRSITHSVFESVEKPKDGSTVLFIGCGDGRGIEEFIKTFGGNYNFKALDYDPDMVKKTKETFKDNPNIKLDVFEASASNLEKVSDSSVDLALSISVLHWLPNEGQEKAMQEASRVLKDDGKLVFEHAVSAPPAVLDAISKVTGDSDKVKENDPWTNSTPENWKNWMQQSSLKGSVEPVERLQPLGTLEQKKDWFDIFGSKWKKEMGLDNRQISQITKELHEQNPDGIMYNRVTLLASKEKQVQLENKSFASNHQKDTISPKSIMEERIDKQVASHRL